jgi:hypothetical protein
VAFNSSATNLVAGDTNGRQDVFVHDRQSGTTTRVSVDSAGTQATGGSNGHRPAISADGRFVAFESDSTNLVAGDTNGQPDIFVHDRQSGVTSRVSVNAAGVQGNGSSEQIRFAISNSGHIAFGSTANNLSVGDDYLLRDVFVTRIPGFVSANSTTTLITGDTPDPSAVNEPYNVAVSVTRTLVGFDVTGNVTISDGSESCIATLSGVGATATGNCNLTSTTPGSKQLVANYGGDANHAASVSAPEPHTVNEASLAGFVVVGDSPDPSRLERIVSFSWSLTPAPIAPAGPGEGTVLPTGTVTVKEAASCAAPAVVPQHQCVANLPADSCQIAFTSTGLKSMQVCYSGDASFASAAASEDHTVIFASVPVSLAEVRSQRLSSGEVEVQFATASNLGSVAFDLAVTGSADQSGSRTSTGEAGERLLAASALLPSDGDSIRAARYSLRGQITGDRFYLRAFEADGEVESFGPFTVGAQFGSATGRRSVASWLVAPRLASMAPAPSAGST